MDGVGLSMHEDPMVTNFGRKGRGLKIENGMVLAIEPMVNVGSVMDTGEVMEGAVLGMFFPKRQNGFREGWIAMAQDALMAVAGNWLWLVISHW